MEDTKRISVSDSFLFFFTFLPLYTSPVCQIIIIMMTIIILISKILYFRMNGTLAKGTKDAKGKKKKKNENERGK